MMNDDQHDAAIRQAYDLWQSLEKATTDEAMLDCERRAERLCALFKKAARAR